MALHEPTTIFHEPAVKPEPLDIREDVSDKSISFNGQIYNFPADTNDEEMLQFLNDIPADEEATDEEPPEPFRETAVIKKDEGVRKDKDDNHISYRDTEKHLTGGRGHLLNKDERKLYPKGTIIPDEVVDAWFKEDMEVADADLTSILEQKATHVPDEVYDILLNMSFNLGKKNLLKFKKMWAAVEVEDWATVSHEMLNTGDSKSKWHKQVGNRAVRLANRMRALAPKSEEQLT